MVVDMTAEQFAVRAFHLNLVDERQLNSILSEVSHRHAAADEAQQIMLRRDLLTNYQAERLLRGDRSGFFYGDYKVQYLVGTGSFARVYRAVHNTTGDVVALKVLRKRYCDKSDESDRFFREGKMGVTLRHPNIIATYSVGADSNTPFLAMEFVEGRNLREFVRVRGKFEMLEATRLAAEIASGLQYAAVRGICHRDLKLSNVLLSSRGQAKIVDFGLAAADGTFAEDEGGANPRTLDYAGLEKVTGARKDDPRSDIYFLGCMYYNMLTGVAPLPDTKDRSQRMLKSRFTDVAPVLEVNPTLPRIIAKVVSRAMELNADQRYQAPGDMLKDLNAVSEKLSNPDADLSSAELPNSKSNPPAPQHSLMVVESSVPMQDLFRERLKVSGFRILVTRDPDRALARFSDFPKPADCILFSAVELGESALAAFNRLDESGNTEKLPAILLLTEQQADWAGRARLAQHRVVLKMPLRLRELREALGRLVGKPVA